MQQRGPSGPLFFCLAIALTRRERSRRIGYAALTTLLLRIHRVQTRVRLGAPSTMTRTVWRLGIQRRFRLLLAWLTWLPVAGPLPQMVQTRAITDALWWRYLSIQPLNLDSAWNWGKSGQHKHF